MDDEIKVYSRVLKQAKELIRKPSEKNAFSIGGRGYYENPTSDILSFYFDPNEEHKLHDLFIKSFFECLLEKKSISHIPSIDSLIQVEREVPTDNDNRIDILIVGLGWVLVIENKIFHGVNNPFSDYKEYVNKQYGTKSMYFTILSPDGKSPFPSWLPVTYGEFIEKLLDNLGKNILDITSNKWLLILREFILNIKEQIGDSSMDEKLARFFEENLEIIDKLTKLKEDYSKYILKKYSNIPDSEIQKRTILTIDAKFKTLKSGVIIGYQNNPSRSSIPSNYVPIIYVGNKDGKLRAQLWMGKTKPITSPQKVNDGNWHHVALIGNDSTQSLYLDGNKIGKLDGKIQHLDMIRNQWGIGYTKSWNDTNDFWFRFEGEIDWVRIWDKALDINDIKMLMDNNSFDDKAIVYSSRR